MVTLVAVSLVSIIRTFWPLKRPSIFAPELGKWNYLIKPAS